MEIPSSYVISKFYQLAGKPEKYRDFYRASCPICREGKSFLKKKRLHYFPDKEYMYCHNCGNTWTPLFWLKEVTGQTYKEILQDIKDYTGEDLSFSLVKLDNNTSEPTKIIPDLPKDCIDLTNKTQLSFYKNNKIILLALNYIKERRLLTAINHPRTYYISLDDYLHKNRLIIPYYNSNHRIESYISRKLLDSDDKAKYLVKTNSDKPIFNLSKIDINFPYIFLFEGAIDAMFIKNGVAISGLYLTNKQEQTLNNNFPFHEKIWCYDNYAFEDDNVKEVIREKLKNGEKVFLYKDEFEKFKDLNDYCKEKGLDFIDPNLLLKNCYSGMSGLLKL